MSPGTRRTRIAEILARREKDLRGDWLRRLEGGSARGRGVLEEGELREQAGEFVRRLREAVAVDDAGDDLHTAAWTPVRELLERLAISRTRQGFTPSEIATFVLSLKEPLFAVLQQELGRDPAALTEEIWAATVLLDRLALYTTEIHQRGREAVVMRQQQELLELSTPVVQLWDGVLGLPLIGILDSARTQVVMENLLNRIVETGSTIAIIDITGVPTVDTLVAQHLLKTVAAARLMGADCIVSGIRPQIAQTIVHLGVELGQVTTKATLADALALALQRVGFRFVRDVRA